MSHPLDRCGRCFYYRVEHDVLDGFYICLDQAGTFESMELPERTKIRELDDVHLPRRL